MCSWDMDQHLHFQRRQKVRRVVQRWLRIAERLFWAVVLLLVLFSGCATPYHGDAGDVLPLEGTLYKFGEPLRQTATGPELGVPGQSFPQTPEALDAAEAAEPETVRSDAGAASQETDQLLQRARDLMARRTATPAE